jgi:hypothetical protein
MDRIRQWLCSHGFHSWTRDAAFFTSASVCRYCDTAENEEEGASLARERELWDEHGSDPDALRVVGRKLFQG